MATGQDPVRPRATALILVVFAVSILGLSAASISSPARAAGRTRTVSGPLVPSGDDVLVGAYVEARGDFTDEDRRSSFVAHETAIGRDVDIANEFFSFSMHLTVTFST